VWISELAFHFLDAVFVFKDEKTATSSFSQPNPRFQKA